MGLGDVVSRVLTEFKADTSQMKAALKDLSAVEKDRARQQLADAEATNKAHESAITKLAHVGLAVETLGKAYNFTRDALKSYGEHQRLVSATAGINIDRLSAAFGGLVTQHDLLTMAAQTQKGVLKLNQGEMETLGKAALALKNRGFELEDAIKKLTDAAVKGKVGGLDDLGLSIKEGASRAETLKNMMGELNNVIAESGGPSNNAADAVDRLSTSWKNAEESMKHYVAAGIMEIPNVLDMASKLFVGDQGPKNLSQADVFAAFQGAAADRYKNGDYNQRLTRLVNAGVVKGQQNVLDSQVIEMPEEYLGGGKDKRVAAASKAYADALARQILDSAQASLDRNLNDVVHGALYEANPSSGLLGARAGGNRDEFGRDIDEGAMARQASMDAIYEHQKGLRDAADEKLRLGNLRESQNIGQLEKIFGPIEQFELYEQAFSHFGATFTAFSEAMGAGYEAIVTGQGGVSAAIKKTLADGLMAIGKSSVVEALRQTALGFGMLAIGSPNAAVHFKSAAMHGAVAVAAGAAAHSLGTSAQVAANEKAAAEKSKEEEKAKKEREKAAGKSGGGSGEKSERPIYILMGSAYDESTPRMRRVMANEAVDKALRERDE